MDDKEYDEIFGASNPYFNQNEEVSVNQDLILAQQRNETSHRLFSSIKSGWHNKITYNYQTMTTLIQTRLGPLTPQMILALNQYFTDVTAIATYLLSKLQDVSLRISLNSAQFNASDLNKITLENNLLDELIAVFKAGNHRVDEYYAQWIESTKQATREEIIQLGNNYSAHSQNVPSAPPSQLPAQQEQPRGSSATMYKITNSNVNTLVGAQSNPPSRINNSNQNMNTTYFGYMKLDKKN